MSQRLAVWLSGEHIADLDEPSLFQNRLTFTAASRGIWGLGSHALSLRLPISDRPLRDSRLRPIVRAWLDGLLPEGQLRQQIAASLRVPVNDVMSLLGEVGGECAGAVQFLRLDTVPSGGWLRPLRAEEVDGIVRALPTYSAPGGGLPHASLAGLQDKVLLAKTPTGWAWPEDGAPSTHLVKPEPVAGPVPFLVEAEQWGLDVAHAAGLSAAESWLEMFGERRAIVVRRYDRDESGRRIHQEDFCQVLGLFPEAKYEDVPEGRLATVARLAAPLAQEPAVFRQSLLRQVVFNVLMGNSDAHSKNYSVLLDATGLPSLAPLYDVAPLAYLRPQFVSAGHAINAKTRLRQITVADLVMEAESWGVSRRVAQQTVDDVVNATRLAIDQVPEPPELPGLASTVLAGIDGLLR